MIRYGPLSNIWAIRMESKHHEYKQVNIQCKKDIPKTIGISAAINLIDVECNIKSKETKQDNKFSIDDAKKFFNSNLNVFLSRKFFCNTEVFINYQKVIKGIVISIGLDDDSMLNFFLIKEVLADDKGKQYLIAQKVIDCGYKTHYDAHLVTIVNKFELLSCEEISELTLKVGPIYSSNGNKYVNAS